MIGYAVQLIRSEDGSAFFCSPRDGFATPVWSKARPARMHAVDLRLRGFRCKVVRVDYQDPILAPLKRAGKLASAKGGE